MESIFGLPAHPFFVHAPVVLMPLATVLAIVLALRAEWRRRVWYLLPVVAAVILVLTQLAISSGETFSEIVPVNTDDHEGLARMTRNFIGLFLLSSLLLAVLDRRPVSARAAQHRLGVLLLVPATTVSSVLATVWMARTGEEGARLVWEGVLLLRTPLTG